jgi:C4-type Zn-finger protein
LFEQQTRRLLDRTDLDEEQKQNILIAMSCPCCGAATMSYTAKLKR